jgi:hypothetical protein
LSKRGQTLAQGIERDKYLNNTKNTQDIEKTETIAVEDMSKEQLVQLFYKLADEGRFDDEDIDDCDGCYCCDDDDDDIGDVVDPVIGFSLENVIDSEFDEEEFNKGIKSMSFVAGQLMALQNAGIKPQNALEYLHATHSQDSDCECAKQVAELQAAVNEKAEKKNLIESKKNIA